MPSIPLVKKGLSFVVSAPSGAGKTSLCRAVLSEMSTLQFSISHTTRPARSGEVNGQDYFFVDKNTFKTGITTGEFLEWAEVHGNYYGTSKKQLATWRDQGIDVLLDIDTQGAMQLQAASSECIYIYILPPSFDILRQRLENRGSDAPEEIARRLKTAGDEIKCYDRYQYLIINEDLEKAQKNLQAIIFAERSRLKSNTRNWVKERFISHL